MSQGQVPVDEAEQNGAIAVACIEADPGFPHRGFARDDGRNLFEPGVECSIARMEHAAAKRVQKMNKTEHKNDGGTRGD
jgi:hypothetical protein